MAANGAPVAPPTSFEEVELLVKRLYEPGNPRIVAAIDDQLKALQHSAQGWQLADALLGSQDDKARFFGALTFQVKLNNDGSRLDDVTAQSVLMRLVHWTTQLDRAGEGGLVRKKLCASLTTYFLRSPTPWDRPLLHLAASFQRGEAVPLDESPPGSMSDILPLLTDSQLVTLLWFAGTLATDAAKVDSTSSTSAHIHKQMEVMVEDAARIIRAALIKPESGVTGNIKVQCLSCFINWVNYAQPMWTANNQEALDHLRGLVEDLASLLTNTETQNDAMDVFRDILESYTSFFHARHMDLLASIIQQHIRPRLLQSLQAREPEVLPVAQLVIAYGIANIQQVVEHPNDELGSKNIVELLFAILQAPGHPGDDDEVSIHSIEFWNTYIEYVNDLMYSRTTDEPLPAWLDHDKQICMRLSMLLWSKMRTPPPDVAEDWSDAESDAFKEFRGDASDLMLSLFVRLGTEMLQQFIQLCLDSLVVNNWQDLEAALYCINQLSDNVLEEPSAEELLVHIFSSSLFREIAEYSQPIPKQARRTAIDTLGTYGAYIERHAEFLPDTLRFLFASLETYGLHLSAAKSIDELCSTCRSSLTGELDGFIAQYHRFTKSETSEPYTNERVMGAIAAIAQALSPESAKIQPLTALLDIVDGIAVNARQLALQGDAENAHNMGVSAVDCLVRIGKGLQVPEDVPIDLYEEDNKPKDAHNFWQTLEGQSIQSRIITICYTVLQLFPTSGEVVDAVCNVLKSGFTEVEPGPFVFAPDMCAGFLEQCSVQTPRVENVLSMVGTLVLQYSRGDSRRIDAVVDRIYRKTISLIQALGVPSQDPSVAQACIEVFSKMLGRYTNILLDTGGSGESVQQVLDFTIKAIDNPDLMPKRSAADFWAKMVKPVHNSPDETVRTRSEQVVAAYGLPLCQALINQITGRGQRSELDGLCEPLRALIGNQSRTKAWLEAALTDENLPAIANPGVGLEDKQKFLRQVLGVRGDIRKMREAVKQFYALCRGTIATYGS